MVDRNVSYYARPAQGPMDEDDAPRAVALLAALTDPVPVGTVERPWGRAGRVTLRAMALVGLVLLAYAPALFALALLDGEIEAFRHQPMPRLQDWIGPRNAPAAHVDAGAPPLLRVLLQAEAWLRSGVTAHHLAGVALHAAVTVVLWLILRRLNRPGGWLAAAMFAVNPGSAAAVEWLGSRGRPWGALLSLLACWLLLRAVGVPPVVSLEAAEYDPDEDPRGIWKWLPAVVNVLLAILGLLVLTAAVACQPAAAAVAPVIILLVAWRRGLRVWDLFWAAPLCLYAAAAVIVFVRTPTWVGQEPAVGALNAVLRPLWWTGRAIQRIGWPLASADLAAVGSHGQVLATCGIGAAAILVVASLVLMRRWLGTAPAVAGVCLLLLLPTMSVPPAVRPLPGLTAARQAAAGATYMVAIPALVLLADLMVAAAQRVRTDLTRRVAELVVATVAIVALGCAAAVRVDAFADTETVLKTAVRVNGRSWDDRSRLAEWYVAKRRPDPALEVMAGLTLANCPDAFTAVAQGDLLVADGNLSGALEWYQRAAALAPNDPEPVGRESSTLVAMGRVGDAVDNYERAIKAHPRSAALHYAFGLLLRTPGLGNLPLAESEFRRAISLDPEQADQHVALAAVVAEQKRPDEAAVELQEAVRLDPENFDAFHDAGLILLQLGAEDRSARMLVEAVRLRPDSAVARSDLSVALIKLHKFKSAKFELTEALRIEPDFPAARSNLGVLERLMANEQRRANVEGK